MKKSTIHIQRILLVFCLLMSSLQLQAQQSSGLASGTGKGSRVSLNAPFITFIRAFSNPNRIELAWADTNLPGVVEEWEVYKREEGGFFSLFAVLPEPFTSIGDVGVAPGITYIYQVVAVGANGMRSSPSFPASATVPAALVAPTNLTATANNNTEIVTLTWQDSNEDESGFVIERSENNGAFDLLEESNATGDNLMTLDDDIVLGNTYSYRVRAKRNSELGPFSNVATVTTMEVIDAPSQLSGSVQSSTSIRINWRDNSDNETKFIIERAFSGTAFVPVGEVGANQTSFTNSGLTPNTNYRFRVIAANTNVTSNPSNIFSARTFNAAPNAPTDFNATFDPIDVAVDFTWRDRSNNDTGHEIQFKLDTETNAQWKPLQLSIGGNATSATTTVTGILGDRTFDLRIRATNAVGASPWSNISSVYLPPNNPALAPPSNLSAQYVSSNQSVAFSWSDNSIGESGFEIEFKLDTESNADWQPLMVGIGANSTSTSTTVAGVLGDRTFDLRIRAINSVGPSLWSNVAQVYLPPNNPPTAARLDDGQPLVDLKGKVNAYPNPFTSTIKFTYPWIDGPTALVISDSKTGTVIRVINQQSSQGEIQWDGKDNKGNLVKPGTYIYQIKGKEGDANGRVVYKR